MCRPELWFLVEAPNLASGNKMHYVFTVACFFLTEGGSLVGIYLFNSYLAHLHCTLAENVLIQITKNANINSTKNAKMSPLR
jgi:hypothetical protein